MSRTIQSPGVEIIENDLSPTANLNFGGTTFFVAGFASKGPTDEIVNIGTLSEFENVFGKPTNAAERYFYHSVKPILDNTTNLVVSRLPYGDGVSNTYGSDFSVLVYPHITLDSQPVAPGFPYGGTETQLSTTTAALTSQPTPVALSSPYKTFVFGQPALAILTEAQFIELTNGGINWATASSFSVAGKTNAELIEDLGSAALLVFNKRQTTVNSQYEGFYVAAIDNSNLDPSSGFNSVKSVLSISSEFEGGIPDVVLPSERLGFSMTSDAAGGSISKVIESLPNFDMYSNAYDDQMILTVAKLRKDPYASNSVKLTSTVAEFFIGSLDAHAMKSNPNGGPQVTNFIEQQTENSGVDVLVRVNPNISDLTGSGWLGNDGKPKNKVRFLTSDLVARAQAAIADDVVALTNFYNRVGIAAVTVTALANEGVGAGPFATPNDSLTAMGEFVLDDSSDKVTGNIPAKLLKITPMLENIENQRIDIIVEGGLSTIYAYTQITGLASFSDIDYSNADLKDAVDALKTSNDVSSSDLKDAWLSIFNIYQTLAQTQRKDCMFIPDLPRWYFVEGPNLKQEDKKDFVFSLNVYWAFKHLIDTVDTSYGAAYANWFKQNDATSGKTVWVPGSGTIAGLIANSDRVSAPYRAPAGFNRGVVTGVLDIALNPNQNARDLLYKLRINAVAKFPEGIIVMAQNTLLKKDSAFSSINVRRAFLLAERASYFTLRLFLFEPNTSFIRSRVVNTLKPIFETIKNDQGFVDYLIVCDERNNTPATIDAKELHIKILIKPTRAIEFIVATFDGTSQGANFSELI